MRFAAVLSLFALAACSVAPDDGASSSRQDLTGVKSAARGLHLQSYVYVPVGADDGAIASAIARQVKSGLGALRDMNVELGDRDSHMNLDPSKWTRQTVSVVDPTSSAAATTQLVKVTFPYDDQAVASNAIASKSAVSFTFLAGDYSAHATDLIAKCSDDTTTDASSLWYHFQPDLSSCRSLIQAEATALATEARALKSAPGAIGPKEAGRWFLPVTAKLDPPSLPGARFSPEYDRLYKLAPGSTANDSELVVYAFFGVDSDETDPDDLFAQEHVQFLRTLLHAQPNFRVTNTNPFAMLLDVTVDGNKLDGVTYDQLFSWIVDKTGYPAAVGTDPVKIAALRRQAIAKLTERWIYWDLPVVVTGPGGATKNLTVEVRSFYGYEDGSPDARQHAQWRYLEAFWYGDVFLYNGHSHFGNGPLEPSLYGPQNFNDRYQLVLVNSCLSYDYYRQDLFGMKPGGSKNLDVMVNGLPSYVQGSGIAVGKLVAALLDGTEKDYVSLLTAMEIDEPWGENAYDPMRVVDGELDNVFSQGTTPLAVAVQPPVY